MALRPDSSDTRVTVINVAPHAPCDIRRDTVTWQGWAVGDARHEQSSAITVPVTDFFFDQMALTAGF